MRLWVCGVVRFEDRKRKQKSFVLRRSECHFGLLLLFTCGIEGCLDLESKHFIHYILKESLQFLPLRIPIFGLLELVV